jgi:hypothetical protein
MKWDRFTFPRRALSFRAAGGSGKKNRPAEQCSASRLTVWTLRAAITAA